MRPVCTPSVRPSVRPSVYVRMSTPLRWAWLVPVAIGRPIEVQQMSKQDPGFDEEAKRLHGLFLAGMEEAFHTCKGLYGWTDMPLSIE